MFKLLSAIALISATVLPIDAAKAAPGWHSYIGQRTCLYLRRGMTAYNAGYKAAEDTISSRHSREFLRDSTRLSESELSSILAVELLTRCPDAMR